MHYMMNKLSKTSKLGTKSWSLQAGIPADGGTCSGALSEDGGYVAACSGCYARGGMYHFGGVPALVVESDGDNQVTLDVTPWQGASWGKACRVSAKFAPRRGW